MQRPGKVSIVACVAVLALTVGCGRAPSFELAPVSGIVIFNSEPYANAVVSFSPAVSSGSIDTGPSSEGLTDAAGRFTLKTIPDNKDGAVVGEHLVRVSTKDIRKVDISSDVDSQPRKEPIPLRYNLESELTFTVPAAGTNAANFDLRSP